MTGFDDAEIYKSAAYQDLHSITAAADAVVLASPIYNWGCCAELKKYIECVGSTPPDRSRRGAFFDKVVTFVNSAGLPHSYMAFGPIAISMMLDFKCIVNPYTVYIHNGDWRDSALLAEARSRLHKSMDVMVELTAALADRSYQSAWGL